MIRALIFDCFGVFYPDPVFAYMHDPLTPPERAEALHAFDDQAARGNLSKVEFIEKASLLLAKPQDDVERQFFQSNQRNEMLVSLVQELRKTYKVALLSNIGSDMMGGFFTPDERRQLFDETILSGDVNLVKPNRAIYNLVCTRLGVVASEAIMVDDMASNIDAVKALGMQGICYMSFKQFRNGLSDLLSPNT